MDTTPLRYFVAAAEAGHFTRAARRCGIAQPSLSSQIKKLESELGQHLFHRIGRRVELTEAGRRLLDRVGPLLKALDEVEREMRTADEPGSGPLAVGAIATVAPYLLPAAIRAFRRRHPDVDLHVREDLTANVIAAVHEGELDLAVVALPIDDERLVIDELFTEPLLVAVHREHPLARSHRKGVSLSELRDDRFILLSEMHCLGEQVAGFCKQLPFPLSVSCRSTQLTTVQELIAMQQGVSLLPAMAAAADRSSQRVYLPLAGGPLTRTLAAVRSRSRLQTPNAREFLPMLKPDALR
jgi:LysR family hydrogen peroxide-inducible transcriptional activator